MGDSTLSANYRQIVKSLLAEYPAGWALLRKIYGIDENYALRYLNNREWRRFYIFKKAVRRANWWAKTNVAPSSEGQVVTFKGHMRNYLTDV